MEPGTRTAACLGIVLGGLIAFAGACSPEVVPDQASTSASPTLAAVANECLDYYTDQRTDPAVTLQEANANNILAASDRDHRSRDWGDLTNWTIIGTAKALDKDSEILPPATKGRGLCIRFSVAKNAQNKWEGQGQVLTTGANTAEAIVAKICDEKHSKPEIVADTAKCKVPKATFATVTATISGVLYSATADTSTAENRVAGTNLLQVAEADLRRQLLAANVAVPGKLEASFVGGFGLWYPCVSSGCCRAY